MLSSQTVAQVKAYPDIVGIISQYITLKQRGRNFLGFCPFHSEKTPSFTVSPEKQIWHCFGCHESGDIISFVRKIDNLSFVDAVVSIAQKAGIEVIEDKNTIYSQEDRDNKQLQELLFFTRGHYEKKLFGSATALNYLLERGLNERIIKEFHLGYADDDPKEFWEILIEKGYPEQIINRSGIFFTNSLEQMDLRFRNRIIYPIIDYQGRTIGFGGRIFLEQNSQMAKYVNSEENSLFLKRKTLYGLNIAQSHIKEKSSVILMEGYMDVITAHQFGFKNTVGSMGTALTEEHIQKLKRFTQNIYLALDSDEAGQKAIERSLDLLEKYELSVFVVHYPAKDPAEFLLSQSAPAFEQLLQQAKSLIEYKYALACKKYGTASIEAKARIIDDIIPLLKKELNPIVKNHYIKTFAKDLKIEAELILAKARKIGSMVSAKNFAYFNRQKDKYAKAEEVLIYLCSSNLEIKEQIKQLLSPDIFIDEIVKSLYRNILDIDLINKDLVDSLGLEEEKAYLSSVLISGAEKHYGTDGFTDYVNLLKEYQEKQKVDAISYKLKELDNQPGQEAEVLKLLQELNSLKKS